ncbi:MarR family transcriptional regulator [Peptostreptococcus anaerobius]|uniref:MarR family transcriptional regulator n=1 Tax=Peptostreptococcus porci TaxID=2652282 RepID=A0A6N7WZP2_9FIRM|nr:MarR family transcriptional regulator [Peptostreptococcus porci]MDD7183775.1 MarR family transcriptional regulator [Peptostreptococcus porci]MDY4128950.1 MarR family transcriptional regulator [Peptostreptococcus porci]MDY5964645.1 MarR family transcriptional regulator [Peptostreptococcus porci]MDY6231258.1 MarR family transcriptional regulator [Peptostreptococcus porci]MST62268.1 MarR family transcriptional regulator [Peptostreptococcus porci]
MINSLGRLISILYRKGNIYKNMILEDFNITASEQPFLSSLFNEDGVSQEYLSSKLLLDKASTTRSLQSLIDKGYIKKKRDDNDKRINRIFLTEKSKSIEKEIKARLENWNDILTSDLNESEKEMAYLILNKMVNNLNSCKKR